MKVSWPASDPTTVGGATTVLNLIVPLDGSELSRGSIPFVFELMELYRATPHLVYAGVPTDPETMLSRLGVEWEQLPGAVIHQPGGAAAESILHLAKELPHALIVMCTHTGHHRQTDSFGSVTESVLAGNPEQILLIAPEYHRERFKVKRIVLAHDGTPAAAATVGPAAELASLARAEVLAVHVAAPRTGSPELGSLPAPQYVDQLQHEWPSWTGEFSARLLALGMPKSSVKFKVMVAGGFPESELAQLARSMAADMVILADSGDWEHSRHKVARAVIRNSGCPVLLVRCKRKK